MAQKVKGQKENKSKKQSNMLKAWQNSFYWNHINRTFFYHCSLSQNYICSYFIFVHTVYFYARGKKIKCKNFRCVFLLFYVLQSTHDHRSCKWVWEQSNGVICSQYSQHHDVSELHTEQSCLLPGQVCDVLDFTLVKAWAERPKIYNVAFECGPYACHVSMTEVERLHQEQIQINSSHCFKIKVQAVLPSIILLFRLVRLHWNVCTYQQL